jgi:hypothetical protein
MRRRARIDANQPLIVKALREAGASVLSLSPMGNGCPDLLVAFHGRNILMEIKDPCKVASQRKLTSDETDFHKSWQGPVFVVETAAEALRLIQC